MLDWLLLALKWLAIATAVSPIVLGIGWAVVEISILPRLGSSQRASSNNHRSGSADINVRSA